MRVVIGVSGGIAAYKVAHLVRFFKERGDAVRVVPTAASLNFVGAATWEALSGEPVSTSVFDGVDEVQHVRLGHEADLVVIAPATADVIARIAAGRADDLLTATVLTATCPIVVAPAMHTEMWNNAATVANVATLRARGLHVMDPAVGRLTGKDTGAGRLPEPQDIGDYALKVLAQVHVQVHASAGSEPFAQPAAQESKSLAGRHVVISAGGTREPLDPVRYLGNNSSGLQGVALAQAALAAGARVTLVAAAMTASAPESVSVVQVGSALEMREAMHNLAPHADVIVMAAAVADFRPAVYEDTKIKKVVGADPQPIALVKNPDILQELTAARVPGQVIVGFAAETGDSTGDVLDHGRAKAVRKQADLLVVNEVGRTKGFGTADNSVVLLDRAGEQVGQVSGTKYEVATAIVAAVAERLV